MTDYPNKICVLTGAGSGMGREMALKLAQRGAVLAISDIDEESLLETKRLIEEAGALPKNSNHIHVQQLDIADKDAVNAYAQSIKDTLGDAHLVINNAGMTRISTFNEMNQDQFDHVVNVDFFGVVYMSKAFLPHLIATKGHLANVSSIFGMVGAAGQTHYCAAKHAVKGFSDALAQEMHDQDVRITVIHPGGVSTNIVNKAILDTPTDEVPDLEAMQKRFETLAGTTPSDAADTILNGIAKNKQRILIGNDARLLDWVFRLLPANYKGFMRWMQNRRKDEAA